MDAFLQRKAPPVCLKYKEYIDGLEKDNPYGVPIGLGNWAAGGAVVSFGTTVCFASKYLPDIIDASHAYKTTNWLFGCHPYHNYSFTWQQWALLVRKQSFTVITGLISHLFPAMLLRVYFSKTRPL